METKTEKTYKRVGKRELKIDVFAPSVNEHTQTAIILLHGGGWQHGDKSMMSLFGPELAKHGFVAFAPEYRLLGESARGAIVIRLRHLLLKDQEG